MASRTPASVSMLSSIFGDNFNRDNTKKSGESGPSLEEQRRHLRASLRTAPPAVNSTRPGKGPANSCFGTVILASEAHEKSYSTGVVFVVVRTDTPLVLEIKKPKFKYANPNAEKTAAMIENENTIISKMAKEITIEGGNRLRISYKVGPAPKDLNFYDDISIQGLDVNPTYTEIKDKPGEFEGTFFYNAVAVSKKKSTSPIEMSDSMEKLVLEQSIPIVSLKPIDDKELMDKVKAQANRITTITRIGGPDSTTKYPGGYWITIPDDISPDKLGKEPKSGAGTGVKLPSMISSFIGTLSNGKDLLPFSVSQTWYDNHIAGAWDIVSFGLWSAMFKTLMGENFRTYVVGNYNMQLTSHSTLLCKEPQLFSSTYSTETETDPLTNEESVRASYKAIEPAFGIAIDTSFIIVEFMSLVRNGYPILNSKIVKTFLPAKESSTDRVSTTQTRGFVCANSASPEAVDNFLAKGWVPIYITSHDPITNSDGEVIPPYQIPADLLWTSAYPTAEKARKERIKSALASQIKSDGLPNLRLGLEQLDAMSGAPSIHKADFIIYLMEPKSYKEGIERLMDPSKVPDPSTVDAGNFGMLVKQSEMYREAAVKIIADHAKALAESKKASEIMANNGFSADDFNMDVDKLPGQDGENDSSKDSETTDHAGEEKKAEDEEATAHQPEMNEEEMADLVKDKKRERTEGEDEDIKAPPAKKSKLPASSLVVKKKAK